MKKIICILLSIVALSHATYGQDVYESKSFGIKLYKPQTNWIVTTTNDLPSSQDKTKFPEEELQNVLRSNKGIFTLAEYRMDSVSGPVPSIRVTVRASQVNTMTNFKQIMVTDTDRLKAVVQNFEFIDNFREVTVSGFPCFFYSCRYSLTLVGYTLNNRTRYYMIPKGSYFITVSLTDEATQDCSQIFDTFMNSLQLSK